jgi:hypothetical protein
MAFDVMFDDSDADTWKAFSALIAATVRSAAARARDTSCE